MNRSEGRTMTSQRNSLHHAPSVEGNGIFLLDLNSAGPNPTTELLRANDYRVEEFHGVEPLLQRLTQVKESDAAPFSLVIDHGMLTRPIQEFLERLNTGEFGVPVLVVDHERFNLRRDDYCRNLAPGFPLFVCSPNETVELVGHFGRLRNRLRKFSFRRDAAHTRGPV